MIPIFTVDSDTTVCILYISPRFHQKMQKRNPFSKLIHYLYINHYSGALSNTMSENVGTFWVLFV